MKTTAFALNQGRSLVFLQKPPSCKTTERSQKASSLVRKPHEAIAEALEQDEKSTEKKTSGRNGHAIRKSANRDLLLDVLSATATRREARSYLSRFNAPGEAEHPAVLKSADGDRSGTDISSGVNLGQLYSSTSATEMKSLHRHSVPPKVFHDAAADRLSTALVLIKQPHTLDQSTLEGIGYTLSQLSRLGLHCVVVISSAGGEQDASPILDWRAATCAEADRVVAAIEVHGDQTARRLDSILETSPCEVPAMSAVKIRGATRISDGELLSAPLHRGTIPVVVCVGYDQSQKLVRLKVSEVMLALARELAGLTPSSHAQGTKLAPERRLTSLDRIIILDPHGGIASTKRSRDSHVFINLEQEYSIIRDDLSLRAKDGGLGPQITDLNSPSLPNLSQSHLENLQLLRDVLTLLPPSSSALITTPQQAATSALRPLHSSPAPGVGTRSHRNPLIHNLLTDRPAFSSSLPRTRLGASPAATASAATLPTTFLKRGMPLTIIPDPRLLPWKAFSVDPQRSLLSDPRIDLPRLIHLIEDSFGRTLDAQHYLQRISSNLAGVIIAGAYEGGAILTWESPRSSSATATTAAATITTNTKTTTEAPTEATTAPLAHQAPRIPYLDKFAVLKRSQGAGGVADIVFSAMVQDCFPRGVCWRSRADNPVNKWYFERSRGSWKIPPERVEGGAPQGWTMFWTTEDIDGETFGAYEAVCRGVESSWADGKAGLD